MIKGENMKRIIICCVFFLALSVAGYCGQISRVELVDGSIIEGEITSFQNGVYTLKTQTQGTIKLEFLKIKKIETSNKISAPAKIETPSQPNVNIDKSDINQLSQKLMSNPDTMKAVSELVADPQFQEIMKDPDIINAAKLQDINALMSNEKFMSLINNPRIQQIGNMLKDQNKQTP
jgi:hypothetical protein